MLGFSASYSLFAAHVGPPSILTYGPGKIATLGTGAGHLSSSAHPFDLMADAIDPFSARRLQTALDLEILAGIYGYTVDVASLKTIAVIPLPGALCLFGPALLGFGILRRRPTHSGD